MTKFDSKSFNPMAFGKYVERIPQTRKNELKRSKALKGNNDIKEAFSSQTGTAYAVLPMYGNLEGTALNYDGATDITADTTTTFERGVVVIGRAKAWKEKDFSEDITGGVNFMDNVANQVAEFWDTVDQDALLSILKGIFAMSGNNGNTDFVQKHTYDISSNEDETGNVGAATLNSAIQQASGDQKNKFALVIMHSVVATNLENMKLLKYWTQTDADGIERQLTLASWNGRTVLIDDSMPSESVDVPESAPGAGDGYTYMVYTTYVLGDGAFDYEDIGAKVPYEMARDASKNGGEETLYTRQRKVFAPYGISYKKVSQASLSPTDTELSSGGNWELVHDEGTGAARKYISHKAIPIAQIKSRG